MKGKKSFDEIIIEKHLQYYHKKHGLSNFKSWMIYESDQVARAALKLNLLTKPLDIEFAKVRSEYRLLANEVTDEHLESAKDVFSLIETRLTGKETKVIKV